MDVNFELYKIFYYVARNLSFSKAGHELFISQSAVSQAIKNLEEKTGTVLFLRRSRNVKLTRDGEFLYKHIAQAYNFIKTAETKLEEIHNMNSGEVRIGVGDTICKYFVIPCLKNFHSIYPAISIQVINRTTSGIIDALKKGLIDFGIVTLPIFDNSLNIREFISVEDIFVASDRFSKLKGRKVALTELTTYPLLMLEKRSATRRSIDSFFQERDIQIRPEIEIESIDLLVDFAKIGLGIAHVLKESSCNAIENNELYQIQTEEKLPLRNLGIAMVQDVPLAHAAAEFLKILLSE